MHQNYDDLSDIELIKLTREKDDDAMEYLIMKYGFIVKHHARTMFLIGAENDDLMQEGMIGLFKAIRDYDEEMKASFPTFATLCVKRQIDTAIKAYNRKKHAPLNTFVSISADDEQYTTDDEIQDRSVEANPELAILIKEQHEAMLEKIKKELSPYENKVVELYLEGHSHTDIAKELEKSSKSIENALNRIRTKLSR